MKKAWASPTIDLDPSRSHPAILLIRILLSQAWRSSVSFCTEEPSHQVDSARGPGVRFARF